MRYRLCVGVGNRYISLITPLPVPAKVLKPGISPVFPWSATKFDR
jgi:hypothetical protein